MAKAHQRETDVAWASGLLDGEGCIQASQDGVPIVTVEMTDERAIRRLHRIFGGTIRNYHRVAKNRVIWRWRVPSKLVAQVLQECLPHLTTKQPEAKVLLHWIDYRAHTGVGSRARQKGLEGTRKRLRVLKQGASGHLPRYPRQVNPSACQPGPPKHPKR